MQVTAPESKVPTVFQACVKEEGGEPVWLKTSMGDQHFPEVAKHPTKGAKSDWKYSVKPK